MSGTKIGSKSQIASPDGTEKIPVSPTGYVTIQQIADLVSGGVIDAILWDDGGADSAPTFITDDPPDAVVGASYSYTFQVSGSPFSSFTVTSGTLPAGLSLSTDGVLSGTPTTGGTSNFQITAANGISPNAQSPTLTIITTTGPPLTQTLRWFDPSDATTVTQAGGLCSVLADKTGHSTGLGASGALRPTVSTIGALQALSFAAGNDMNSDPLSQPQPLTVFIVVQASASTVTAAASANTEALGTSTGTTPAVFGAVPSAHWAMYNGTTLESTVVMDTAVHVLCGVFNGATSTLELDGVQIAAGQTGSAGFVSGNIALGATTGQTSPWLGKIGEIIYYASALSSSDRVSVQSYLSAKWGASASPSFVSDAPPGGTVGTAYSYTFVASGAPAPTFSVTSGSLPLGLSLSSGGALTGTPTTAATSHFVVTATNGVSPDAVSGTLTIVTVSGAPLPATLSWYDPSDSSSITVASGTVTALADKSMHGHDLVNSGSPGLSTINGLAAVNYGAAGASALYSNSMMQAQPVTTIAVVQASPATIAALASGFALVHAIDAGASSHPIPGILASQSNKFWASDDGTRLTSAVAADANPHVISAIYNGVASSLWLDGVQIASGDSGSAGFDAVGPSAGFARIILGAGPFIPAGLVSPWLGLIGEVLQFTSALSPTDRSSVEAYLKAKWGTP